MSKNKRKKIEEAFVQLAEEKQIQVQRPVRFFRNENEKMDYTKRSIGCRSGFRPASDHSTLRALHFSEENYSPW